MSGKAGVSGAEGDFSTVSFFPMKLYYFVCHKYQNNENQNCISCFMFFYFRNAGTKEGAANKTI